LGARDHFVGDLLADLGSVSAWRDFLANPLKGSRHVRQSVLIEFKHATAM
jgi:hypothetical protein